VTEQTRAATSGETQNEGARDQRSDSCEEVAVQLGLALHETTSPNRTATENWSLTLVLAPTARSLDALKLRSAFRRRKNNIGDFPRTRYHHRVACAGHRGRLRVHALGHPALEVGIDDPIRFCDDIP
jgi:hypothetical protein